MFKQLIKKTPKIKEEATPTMSGVKKKSHAAKTPIPPSDLALGTLSERLTFSWVKTSANTQPKTRTHKYRQRGGSFNIQK